jgi:hypothetical protein
LNLFKIFIFLREDEGSNRVAMMLIRKVFCKHMIFNVIVGAGFCVLVEAMVDAI